MSSYNYVSFPHDGDMEDFLRFPERPRVGTKAPTGELVNASDESRVSLARFFEEGVTVLEFGSFT